MTKPAAFALPCMCAVGGAIARAAITAFVGGRKPFAWYSIGLAVGFFLRLIVSHLILAERVLKTSEWFACVALIHSPA
jgi:hypothetical protein